MAKNEVIKRDYVILKEKNTSGFFQSYWIGEVVGWEKAGISCEEGEADTVLVREATRRIEMLQQVPQEHDKTTGRPISVSFVTTAMNITDPILTNAKAFPFRVTDFYFVLPVSEADKHEYVELHVKRLLEARAKASGLVLPEDKKINRARDMKEARGN